jgi:HPt (histidine-containing phosphotransfer) domain-containing protein
VFDMPALIAPSTTPLDIPELLSRCLGKRELAHRVLGRFQRQLTEDVTRLHHAVAHGEAHVVAKIAHRIKGAAANVSAHELHERASTLEEAARLGLWDRIPSEVESLAAEREVFETALQEFEEDAA